MISRNSKQRYPQSFQAVVDGLEVLRGEPRLVHGKIEKVTLD
jgi:hypothetical protein